MPPPARVWSSSVRRRYSCAVAGNVARAIPAANDGTGVYTTQPGKVVGRGHRCRAGSATACARWCAGGRRAGTAARARRSPRRARRASRRWSSSTRDARSGSAPSVARRSASGSSESSRTRAGNIPSARPHTNTRSRSRPSPSATWPMRMPSPRRPRARGRRRAPARACGGTRRARASLDRVEPGQALERRLDLVGRLPFLLGPGPATALGGEVVVHETLGPAREVAPAVVRVDGERAREVSDELLQAACRRQLPLVVLGMWFAVGHHPLARRRIVRGRGRGGRGDRATAVGRARRRRSD